jgi:hypothetical protein
MTAVFHSRQFTVTPFNVVVPRVEVKFGLRSTDHEVLMRGGKMAKDRYREDVARYALEAVQRIEAGEARDRWLAGAVCPRRAFADAVIFRHLKGWKRAEMTLRFPRAQWEWIERLAKLLDVSPEVVIRGALNRRAETLLQFERCQRLAKGGSR